MCIYVYMCVYVYRCVCVCIVLDSRLRIVVLIQALHFIDKGTEAQKC